MNSIEKFLTIPKSTSKTDQSHRSQFHCLVNRGINKYKGWIERSMANSEQNGFDFGVDLKEKCIFMCIYQRRFEHVNKVKDYLSLP